MSSFSFIRLLSPYTSRCFPSINIMSHNRNITKGVVKTIRDKLPKYKKDISKLPPLTGLLVKQDNISDAIEIRKQKLEVYKEYIPISTNTNYLEALFNENSNDVDKVLKIIDENLETLNSFLVAVSFEALDDLMVGRLCDPMTVAVAPEFKRLCQKAIYKMRFFEVDEVLKLLKCLSDLDIPEDTLIVQAGFQMARHHINDFNYDELELLKTILERFDEKIETSKSLLVALKSIIPRAKERQIKEKQCTTTTSLSESNQIEHKR